MRVGKWLLPGWTVVLLCWAAIGCGQVARDDAGVACTTSELFITPALRESETWYGAHLRAAGEGSLCEYAGSGETYRFTWLRSFHEPVIIRVGQRGDGISLTAKRLDGAGGYEPGRLVESRTLTLDTDEWREFQRLLEKLHFWSAAVPEAEEELGMDGAQWILEGVREDKYRAIDRWTPERRTATWNVGVFLLDLAEMLPADKDQVY